MKFFGNIITHLRKLSIALCCLFLLTQCDETRYIDEADIPNIKPGGRVFIYVLKDRGTPDPIINLRSECELLGVRESGTSIGGKKLFRADFQTVNKPEELLLTIDFTIDRLITSDSAACSIVDLVGSFKQNNKSYLININDFEEGVSQIGFSNLDKKGIQSNFSFFSSINKQTEREYWLISFQSNLLP